MKASTGFKEAISSHLEEVAAKDPLFAETLKKPGKNIDDCLTYIMNQAKNNGCAGYSDQEVFGWAKHYYDEDDIKVGSKISGKVIINRSVELSEEDKAAAFEQAMAELREEKKKELASTLAVELSPEEIQQAEEAAKQEAFNKVAAEQQQKLVKKAEKKKPVQSPELSGLFD